MAKVTGAKVSKVAALHELLVDMFTKDIQFCISEGIPMSASDKGVIVAFLKNEGITATPENEQLQTLKEEFSALSAERRIKAVALIEAAEADALPMS